MLPGQGTYFMIADIRPLLPPGSTDTDVDFCQKLTVDVGVTLIPVSGAMFPSHDSVSNSLATVQSPRTASCALHIHCASPFLEAVNVHVQLGRINPGRVFFKFI